MPQPQDDKSGLLDRVRRKLSARRVEVAERAHVRNTLKADREARAARGTKHSGPPNVGGGV